MGDMLCNCFQDYQTRKSREMVHSKLCVVCPLLYCEATRATCFQAPISYKLQRVGIEIYVRQELGFVGHCLGLESGLTRAQLASESSKGLTIQKAC